MERLVCQFRFVDIFYQDEWKGVDSCYLLLLNFCLILIYEIDQLQVYEVLKGF